MEYSKFFPRGNPNYDTREPVGVLHVVAKRKVALVFALGLVLGMSEWKVCLDRIGEAVVAHEHCSLVQGHQLLRYREFAGARKAVEPDKRRRHGHNAYVAIGLRFGSSVSL